MKKMNCDTCDRPSKRLRQHKGNLVCYVCYRRACKLILGGALKFDELLQKHGGFTLNLTDEQFYFYQSRVLQLGITKTAYLRELIINDMLNNEESLFMDENDDETRQDEKETQGRND